MKHTQLFFNRNNASLLVLVIGFLWLPIALFPASPQKKSQKKSSSSKKAVAQARSHASSNAASKKKQGGKPPAASKLRTLQRDIERDRAKLRAVKQQERATAQHIKSYREKDKQLQTSLQKISVELRQTQDSVRSAAKKISSTDQNAQELRRRYAAVVRMLGLHSEASDAEYLNRAGAMEEELLTQGIVRHIAANTDKRLNFVQRERDSLAEAQARFRAEYGEAAEMKHRTESEKNKVVGELKSEQKELRGLQATKQQLMQQIEEKKASARKMERIIAGMVGKSNNSSNSSNDAASEPSSSARSGASRKHSSSEEETNQATYEARAASVRGGFRRHSLPFPVQGAHRTLHSFGAHTNAATGTVIENPGIDIQSPKGTSVCAVAKGTVSLVNWLPGYGSLVIIDHGNTFRSVYANLASVKIQQGQAVKAGTVLGVSGRAADGEYVHFELWHDRHKLNPAVWLQ